MAFALGISGLMSFGQATDLIISEYVEGSGNNKYIELYNGTGSNVDLSNYQLQLFANGSSTPSTATLTGILSPGTTIVYKNSSATIYGGAATNSSVANFNGNDAVALRKISTGLYVDIFGNIGCDPGSSWTFGANGTADRSWVRKPNICAGVTADDATSCPFATLGSEWTPYAVDDISHLGSHTMTCGPTVNMASTGSTVAENVGTVTITLPISPATTGACTITVQVANGTGAFHPQDYTTAPAVSSNTITVNVPSGATSASFSVAVIDDALTENTETVTFTITGTTGDLAMGAALAYALNITNNDATPTYSFSTPPTAVLENVGTVTVTIGILPNAGAGGNLLVNIANGVGAVYSADHTTSPTGASGTMTIPVPANATSVTFNVTVLDDAVIEDTEVLTFTISGAPGPGLIGTTNSTVLSIGDNDSPATILLPGDIAIIGVNANNGCDPNADDIVSFVSFKPITPGTTIDMTDNGYGLCPPGPWSDNEGMLRLTRTGPTIPAGQVITIVLDADIATNAAAVAPDAQWSSVRLGSVINTLALNNIGDQIFFLQGGVWADPAGTHNATYTGGRILYAFSTNGGWGGSCSTSTSGLPASLECFSMAPTSSTSFAKFTGDISTPKTQREWLIAIDEPLNWTSYANCTAYNTTAPLWNLSPTLPIIAGPMQNGLWTGAKSTDWFDCRNWDDAQVPTVTSNVVIDQRFAPNCVITSPNISTSTTADCASLTIRSNNSLGKTLIVDQGRSLLVTGNTLIERTNSLGAACGLTLQGGSTFQTTNLTIRGVTSDAQEAYFSNALASNTVTILGHLRNEVGGRLTLTNGTLRLAGDFVNQNSEARFEHVGSTVILNGAGTQNISTSGFEELFHTLRVEKTAGTVTLNSGVGITNALELIWGRIFMNSSILTVRSGASASGANDNSFVHGAMRKVGNTDFVFPIGKGTHYRPAHLSTIEGDITDGFRAEYFAASPITTFTPYAKDPTLHHISDCEYWTIDRSGGNATAWVNLTWNTPSSCGVDALPDLRVARWDGSTWRDQGNGGATGNSTTGTIITAAQQLNFSPWTLASVNSNNPLPIELLYFRASALGNAVDLQWGTATETDNAFFTVERSRDLEHFNEVLVREGAGNSLSPLHYRDQDTHPLTGTSYYRLRQTDVDGRSTLSAAVPVHFDGSNTGSAVHVAEDRLIVFHPYDADATYQVLDIGGKLISRGRIGSVMRSEVPLPALDQGVYLLRIDGSDGAEVVRFVR